MAKDVVCDVCGENPGKKKISDGVVCKECLRKTPPSFAGLTSRRHITVEQFCDAIRAKEESDQRLALFQASEQVGKYFAIDKTHNWFKVRSDICLPCDAIVDFDLVEKGRTVEKKGLGSAMVGGALFGGPGALIGYSRGKKQVQETTSRYVKIATWITGYSVLRIDLTYGSTRKAEQIMSLLAAVVSQQGDVGQIDQAASFSVADELAKLSQLRDSGVLTQQEFDEQKKRLLA